MKILSILFLVILLTMAMGCGSQSESGTQVPNTPTSSIEARLSKLEKQIDDMQKELGIKQGFFYEKRTLLERVETLEEKVIEPLFYLSRIPQSLEGRVKALEERVLSSGVMITPSYFNEDKIRLLEKRVTELEKKLGVSQNQWQNPWQNP